MTSASHTSFINAERPGGYDKNSGAYIAGFADGKEGVEHQINDVISNLNLMLSRVRDILYHNDCMKPDLGCIVSEIEVIISLLQEVKKK
jgi:hypothetical protein